MKSPKVPKSSAKPDEPIDEILGKDLRQQILAKAKATSLAADSQQGTEVVIPKLMAADCREAIHWFAGQAAHLKGSARSLLATDFSDEQDAVLESALLNMKARGVTPLILTGDVVYKQAEYLWDFAVKNATFARPVASKFEIEISGADVLILKDLEAPERSEHLWYLYHYILYPRALANKPNLLATQLRYEEFVMYGAGCDDFEYAGRKVSWEKVLWLLNNTGVDLHFFRQLKDDGHPIMLPPEYVLFKALRERNLNVMPQHVLADRMFDFALIEKGKDHRLDIECDLFDQVDSSDGEDAQVKGPDAPRFGGGKNNWQTLRFSYAEILHNAALCADAAEEVWRQGRKKSAAGRLVGEQASFVLPALPMQDDAQKSAITHTGGPAAITGGAGTGKTTCLLYRLAFLIGQGVNPDRILTIGYSQDTLRPLKSDLEKLTDKQVVQRVSFYAWHDFGLKILKENLAAIKRKPPLKTEPNPQKIIQKLLLKYKKELDPAQLELSEELDELTIASLISIYKANLISPAYVKEKSKSTIDELVAKVYQAYEEQLQKSNRVDRDDMVTLAGKLLAEEPDIRKRYQYQFDHVLVDEYQDATPACDLLARLLSFPQDNIFVAGDEDESMDESKGALPRLISDISIRQPNARCYVLENNWRCHPTIVEHAQRLLKNYTRRRINKAWHSGWGTTAGATITGPRALADEQQEAEWVAEEVQLLFDTGRKPEDIGIFYRYHRFGSIIEEALAAKGIRSITSDADYGVVPDEAADVMAFLRLIMDPDGPKARESFERVCQLRMREVDPKLSIEIAKYAEALNLSYLKAIELYSEAVPDPACKELQQLASVIRRLNQENMPPAENIGFLARTQRLKDFYSSLKVPPGVRYEPLRALKQMEEEARKFKTVTEFVRHQAKQSSNNEEAESSVNILTLHEAKGREYNIVFLVGLAEGLFPAETSTDREEERRLFYVGMTRAREHLYLSYPSAFSEVPLQPSSFLIEAGFSLPKRAGVEGLFPEGSQAVPLQLPSPPVQPQPPAQAVPPPKPVVPTPKPPLEPKPTLAKPVQPALPQVSSQPVVKAVADVSLPPMTGATQQPRIPTKAPPPAQSPLPPQPQTPARTPPPAQSPLPPQSQIPARTQPPAQSPLPPQSQIPARTQPPAQSPLPPQSQIPARTQPPAQSPLPPQPQAPARTPPPAQSPLPPQSQIPARTPPPAQSPLPPQSQIPVRPQMPARPQPLAESPLPPQSQIPARMPPQAQIPDRPQMPDMPGSSHGPVTPAVQASTQRTSQQICPGCKAVLDPGSKFCADCGRAVELAIPACHLCGAPLPAGAKFCGECGSKLIGPVQDAGVRQGNSRQVTAPTSGPKPVDSKSAATRTNASVSGMPVPPHLSKATPPINQRGWVDNLMKFLEGDGST